MNTPYTEIEIRNREWLNGHREQGDWDIIFNYPRNEYSPLPKCEHIKDDTLPRVVRTWTQDGKGFTITCIDCILETANRLADKTMKHLKE